MLDSGNVSAVRLRFGHGFEGSALAPIWSEEQMKEMAGAEYGELVDLTVTPPTKGKLFLNSSHELRFVPEELLLPATEYTFVIANLLRETEDSAERLEELSPSDVGDWTATLKTPSSKSTMQA